MSGLGQHLSYHIIMQYTIGTYIIVQTHPLSIIHNSNMNRTSIDNIYDLPYLPISK